MLVLENLKKSYGKHRVLEGIDLTVEAGEVCALLGANGAGKSTMISVIAGQRSPDVGSVTIGNRSVTTERRQALAQLGVAPQDIGLYLTLTVRENLRSFCSFHGVPRSQRAERIAWVTEHLQLEHLLDRPARALSGGEQRRAHAAAAMLHRPKMLILDEPTAGVDITTRARLLEAIARIAREDGVAVLYTTHYFPEVTELGASIAMLDNGRIVARGEQSELLDRHGHRGFLLTFGHETPRNLGEMSYNVVDKNTVRVATSATVASLGDVLRELGPGAEDLQALEVVRPTLENVFNEITTPSSPVDASALAEELS